MTAEERVRLGDEHLIIELFDVLAYFSEPPVHDPKECPYCSQWWERRDAVMDACRERWR